MERKKNELVAGVAKLGNGTKAEAATISDLWMELQDQFGGADQFAAFWKQQLMRAASSHKGSGSARVLATCANLAKICAMSSQHEVAKMSVSKMTDKQLADELLGLLRQLPLDQRRRLLEVSEIPDVEYEVK